MNFIVRGSVYCFLVTCTPLILMYVKEKKTQ